MNSCILMAEIIQDPQLRYTPDNQIPIAEMLVQFPGSRAEDPPATLKVVGWGNLAQEIQERYHQGDRVVIEGRLNMNTIDRPEGFKEKRAELTAQRIHSLGANADFTAPAAPSSAPSNVVPLGSRTPATPAPRWSDAPTGGESKPSWQQSPAANPQTPPPATRPASTPPSAESDSDSSLDEIPF